MKILITRPEAKAQELKQLLATRGISTAIVPLLTITPLPANIWQQTLTTLLNDPINGLIFVSPIAVNYFCQALAETLHTLTSIPSYALGSSSAKCLADFGFTKIFYPKQQESSEGLLTLPQLKNVVGQKFILIRGTSGRELITSSLCKQGGIVRSLSVYQNARQTLTATAINLLQDHYDLIVITSTEALRYFLELCQVPKFKHLLQCTITVMPGQMQELAQHHGLKSLLILKSFSQQAIIKEILSI